MGKLRQTALILGEGPTEFFYFKSLCDVFKRITIKPDYPKHTNIKELDAKCGNGLQPYLLHYRHGHEGQGAGAFTIPEAKGEVRQAYRQTKERHLLRG